MSRVCSVDMRGVGKMGKHTAEPWHCKNKVGYVFGTDGQSHVLVANVGDFRDEELVPFSGERWQADANRIVACVNACAGIPTEQLEAGCVLELVDAVMDYMTNEDHEFAWSEMKTALKPFQKESD